MLVLAIAGNAGARTLTLDVERVRDARVDVERMHLQLADGAHPMLEVSAERASSAQLGLSGRIDWSCSLQQDAGGVLACAGPVRLRDGAHEQVAELGARVVDGRIDLSLDHAGGRVMLSLPIDPAAPVGASLQHVPAAWLARPLAAFWPGGELRAGTIDLTASLPGNGGVDVEFAGDGLVFNTNDGVVSGEGVTLRGHLATSTRDVATQVRANARLSAGTLRAGALRIEFPAGGVDVDLDARAAADGRWDVARFAWRDPDALEFQAAGVLDTGAVAPLRSLTVSKASLVFPLAKQRYAAPLFAAHGLAGLNVSGRLDGTAEVDVNGVRRLTLQTPGLELRDAAHAVSVQALTGGLDWVATGEGNATRLGWRTVRIGGVALGASSAQWQSRDGTLRLRSPLRLPAFGGHIELRDTLLAPFASNGAHAESGFVLHDLGYDSSDGSLAAAHVAASGQLQLDAAPDGPRIRVEARLDAGEVLIGPVYATFPDSGITTALDLAIVGDRWRIARFDWNDPGVLELGASGELLARAGAVQSLELDVRRAQLATALPRYASSWLSTKGYAELAAKGSIGGTLALSEGKPLRFALHADDVAVHDGRGRFALDGLDGGIDWDLASDRPATTLGWRGAELFRIPLGATRARLQSLAGAITLVEPLAVDVLGGQVRLERFSAQPRSPRGDRYAGSFALAGIEMAQISRAFAWPSFPGKLSGGIPEIEFAGDRIEFHGGLDLYVFDGHLGVSGLALERPFGVAPSLAADVHFENFDLQQVTSAFSFGGMSGRLFGTIAALRLVDWSPVVFDAWLRTDGGGRMSYKAVNDLTAIGGGGGLSASLQTMALKIFDTFGYHRLGIRCRLRDEICTMGGIDPLPAIGTGVDSSTAGYTIVEGSGVPRITIVGHRRSVDWPTLVRRLQEATQGQGPVIE
jgi:hypothetical protein